MLPAVPLVSIDMHACLKIRYAIAVLIPQFSLLMFTWNLTQRDYQD
jgi:hypothetical protein